MSILANLCGLKCAEFRIHKEMIRLSFGKALIVQLSNPGSKAEVCIISRIQESNCS